MNKALRKVLYIFAYMYVHMHPEFVKNKDHEHMFEKLSFEVIKTLRDSLIEVMQDLKEEFEQLKKGQ